MTFTVAFRVDASLEIGTGHVMRCLTLADALRTKGFLCHFITRKVEGHQFELIARRGHFVIPLDDHSKVSDHPSAASDQAWLGVDLNTEIAQSRRALGQSVFDWLVVDHYALDRRWECALRPACKKIFVIDDLANRPHECDLLLDQNLGRTALDYDTLIDKCTPTLIGPKYALLRPEFAALREKSLERRSKESQLRQILITLGGIDQGNCTERVLEELAKGSFAASVKIKVVMGTQAPWLQRVRIAADRMPFPTEILVGVDNMALLMTESDLAIGAAGSTSWERCCLGLPTIQMVLAPNQIEAASALSNAGAAITISDVSTISEQIQKLTQMKLSSLSTKSANICNGEGAQLVRDALLEHFS